MLGSFSFSTVTVQTDALESVEQKKNSLAIENVCDRLHSHRINFTYGYFQRAQCYERAVLHLLDQSSYFLLRFSVLPHNVLWTCSDRSSVASDSCPQSYKALSRLQSKQIIKREKI